MFQDWIKVRRGVGFRVTIRVRISVGVYGYDFGQNTGCGFRFCLGQNSDLGLGLQLGSEEGLCVSGLD